MLSNAELSGLSLALVMLGICQLGAGFCATRTIIQEITATRKSWWLLGALILLFAACYAAFAIHVSNGNGSPVTVLVGLVFASGGTFVFVVTRLSKLTIREARQLATLEAENLRIDDARQRLQSILDNTAEGIITFNSHGRIESCNQACIGLFGLPQALMLGRPITELVRSTSDHEQTSRGLEQILDTRIIDHDHREIEALGLHVDGRRFPLSVRLSQIKLQDEWLFTALVSDVSERKAMLDRLHVLAERDTTTQLHNKTWFQEQLGNLMRDCDESTQASLLYLDLDNFKLVNDILGHAAGDTLLNEVAERLLGHFPEYCLVARFGGDEFTVLVPDLPAPAAMALAESLLATFTGLQVDAAGQSIQIGCSIGIARLVDAQGDAQQMLAQADMACHWAKRAGKNRVRLFEPEDKSSVEALSRDMGCSQRIKSAIDDDRLVLAGQPIVDIATGRADFHEVLVRMIDKDGQLVMPSQFLPVAERLCLASAIDKWVIAQAIQALVGYRRQLPELRFALNLSAQTLSDDSVWTLIEQQLGETGLDPAALTFEITETAAITSPKVAERLLFRLREVGCRTALDDFGSGLCSFGYLQDLPVDLVKIDGRFVKSMASNAIDASIVQAINTVVHANGMRSVAECVEDESSLAMLADLGVDYAQGYHISRPHPLTHLQTDPHRRAA